MTYPHILVLAICRNLMNKSVVSAELALVAAVEEKLLSPMWANAIAEELKLGLKWNVE